MSRKQEITRIFLPYKELSSSDTIFVHHFREQLALALKLYKFQHNQYPDSLAVLQPEPLKTIPTDPFSGKDFIYRKQDEGFIIYSVGRNLKDDGGKADKDEDKGDIVWKCNK